MTRAKQRHAIKIRRNPEKITFHLTGGATNDDALRVLHEHRHVRFARLTIIPKLFHQAAGPSNKMSLGAWVARTEASRQRLVWR